MNVRCNRRTAVRHRWLRYSASGRMFASFCVRARARWARKEHCKTMAALRRCASARATSVRIRIGGHRQRERKSMQMTLEWVASMLRLELFVVGLLIVFPSGFPEKVEGDSCTSLPRSTTCKPPRHSTPTFSLKSSNVSFTSDLRSASKTPANSGGSG
jgi:hypothetical protein